MGLIVAEGFDDVSSSGTVNSHLGKVYSYSGATISQFQNAGGVWGGRFSHGYAKGLTNSNSTITWSFSPRTTVIFACSLRRSAAFASPTPRVQFRYGGASHVEITFRGPDGTDLGLVVNGTEVGLVPGYFVLNTYKWLSVLVTISPTSGQVSIKGGSGELLLSYTGNTYNPSAGQAQVDNINLPTGGSASNNTRIDDVFIMDTSGTSFNAHLTEMSIKPLYANANGDLTTNWTPVGASALWDCVDEAFFDGDSTYASTTSSGNRLSVNIQDPGPGDTNVVGVIVNSAARRDDAASWSWKNFLRISGTNYDDPDAPTTAVDSYVHRSSVWLTNPANSQAWSTSDLTNLQIGVRN